MPPPGMTRFASRSGIANERSFQSRTNGSNAGSRRGGSAWLHRRGRLRPLRERYFGALYAKAQNLLPAVRHAYDRLFEEVDVLVMPTATHYAHRHEPDASLSERVERGDSMIRNTAVFNGTGHPALSIPAAEADALPVGVMLVGRRFADAELLSLARTYEAQVGWRPRRDP